MSMTRRNSGAVVAAGGHAAAGDDHVPDRGQARQHAPDQVRVGVVPGSRQLDVHGVAAQFALELVGRARGDDPAAVHDREPARQPVRFLQVVRGQQHGHPLTAGQPRDLLPHGGPGLGVQARGGLVEEQHRGPVHQAQGHVQAALHPAGVGLDQPPRRLGQPEVGEQLVRASSHGGAAQPVQPALQDQVLPAGGSRVGA
jgi:hypothetical protein